MFLIFFYLLGLFSYDISIALDFPSNKNIVKEEIVPSNGFFVIEDDYYFGIKLKLASGWKTYWKNPGDSGAPLEVKWQNDNNNSLLETLYPFPEKFVEKGITTIGYENSIIFPIKIEPKEIKSKKQEIQIDYLVCKEVCIPVTSNKILNLGLENIIGLEEFKINLNRVPQTQYSFFNVNQYEKSKNNDFFLQIKSKEKKENIEVFGYSNETTVSIDNVYDQAESSFKVSVDDEIRNLKEPILISISDGEFFEEIIFWPDKNLSAFNIFYYIAIAILGGIILNFMPCVLPVLSLKLYNFSSLNKMNQNRIRISCFYIITGIFFSFLSLAVTVITFKVFGKSVGWGFQFQNIYFLISITLIILLFSLNLLGFFEIILPSSLLNKVNKSMENKGVANQFLSGAFATLLATPCSAPFLGTAVGFSMLASNYDIIIIFMSISLGFSAPYLFVILFPNIINLLPKPGNWMTNFKYFLGFLLFLSSIWLLSLLNVDFRLITLMSIIVLYYSYKRKKNNFKRIIFILFTISSTSFLVDKYFFNKSQINWLEFDNIVLQENLDKEKIIIIDVTADWCVTCQINKLTTLDTKRFHDYVFENDIITMRADWTKKDPTILDFIKQFGRYGIPVNIVYGPKNKEGILLPEIISNDMVVDKFIKVGVE